MNERLTSCLETHPLGLAGCVDELTDPEGDFKREFGECITGNLTPEETVWSDRLVRTWTNFARTG